MNKASAEYSRHESLVRLAWLARRLKEHQTTIFLIEDLQPSWLTSKGQRAAHLVGLSLILGVSTGLVALLFSWTIEPTVDLVFNRADALWVMLQLPVWFLCIGILDVLFPAAFSRQKGSMRNLWITVGKILTYLLLWMLWPLLGYWLGGWPEAWAVANVLEGMFVAVLIGALGHGQRAMVDIRSVEAIHFSPAKAAKGGYLGTLVGFVVYLAYLVFCIILKIPLDTSVELFCAVSYSLLGTLCGVLLGGLVPSLVSGKTKPNQGILMSIRNAGLTSLWGGPLFGVTSTLLLLASNWSGQNHSTTIAVNAGLGVVLVSAYSIGLWFGGLAALKHYLLRAILVVTNQAPRDFVGFLEHAVRLQFLQPVGGGYMFLHRTVLEHFAGLSAEDIKSLESEA